MEHRGGSRTLAYAVAGDGSVAMVALRAGMGRNVCGGAVLRAVAQHRDQGARALSETDDGECGPRLARVGKGKAVTDTLWSSGGSAEACTHGGRSLIVLVLADAAVKKKKEAREQSE